MKYAKLLYLSLSVFIIGVFVVRAQPVEAATLLSTFPASTSSIQTVGECAVYNRPDRGCGQSFNVPNGEVWNISGVSVTGFSNTTPCGMRGEIRYNPDGFQVNDDQFSGYLIASSTGETVGDGVIPFASTTLISGGTAVNEYAFYTSLGTVTSGNCTYSPYRRSDDPDIIGELVYDSRGERGGFLDMVYSIDGTTATTTPAAPSPEIFFHYPTDGAPKPYKDFYAWLIDVSALPATTDYIGVVYDEFTTSTGEMAYNDYIPYSGLYASPIPIHKTNSLSRVTYSAIIGDGAPWYARAYYHYASSGVGYTIYTAPIFFKAKSIFDPDCVLGFCMPDTTSTLQINLPPKNYFLSPSGTLTFGSTTTPSQYACGITEISGCLKNAATDVIDYLVSIPDSVGNRFALLVGTVASSTARIFPFSVVASINAGVNSAASSHQEVNITLGGHGTFGGRTFHMYSSTTTEWIITRVGFDYPAIITRILYLGTGIVMLLLSIEAISSAHREDV